MWLILRLLKSRKSVFRLLIITLVFLVFFVGLVVSVALVASRQSFLAAYFLTRKAESVAESLKISKVVRTELPANEIHTELNPAGGNEGVRGNGLSLLLIDQIKDPSYVKELLQLYADSAQGKVSDTEYNLPLGGLLGIHLNESGVYSGTEIIPNSYLPYDSKTKKITWNEAYGGLPADALTLRKFDTKAAATIGKTVNSYGISTGNYANVLQIDKSYWSNNYFKSKLRGYSGSNNVDMMFLPDSISYMNHQFTTMMNRFKLDGDVDNSHVAMASIWHNGGEGYFQDTNAFGVSPGITTYLKSLNDGTREEYKKFVTKLPEEFIAASTKYTGEQLSSITKDESAGAGIILLMDAGYYLSDKAYAAYTTGMQRANGNMFYRNAAFISAWKKLKGETLTEAQSYEKLKPYKKTVVGAYPGYATSGQVSTTYGDRATSDVKGGIFKLSEETSSVYKNKINGKDPRAMHVVNVEIVGHMFSAVSGDYMYAKLLKLSGVDVDMTNPAPILEQAEKDGEFIPKGGEFSLLLKKMGVDSIDPKVLSMLEEGYRVSGQYYNWGGTGQEINQDNWDTFASQYGSASSKLGSKRYYSRKSEHFRTKDGSDPSVRKNRRNDNLVNYKGLVFDCSGLVQWAYNNSKAKSGGRSLERNTSGQASSSLLTTISDRSQARAGDIFVVGGSHVFFVIAKGNSASLSAGDTKSSSAKGSPGNYWVLEASTTGELTGIHSRRVGSSYKLRRFNTLK